MNKKQCFFTQQLNKSTALKSFYVTFEGCTFYLSLHYFIITIVAPNPYFWNEASCDTQRGYFLLSS